MFLGRYYSLGKALEKVYRFELRLDIIIRIFYLDVLERGGAFRKIVLLLFGVRLVVLRVDFTGYI